MNIRRRRGATLGLVAVIVLVIVVIGVAVYFLAKMLGGGREIANATDSGTLNVAKHIIRDSRVPTPASFLDCEYPMGCGYINLLTYNRCVAKAIMIGSNAANMTGPGSYVANANKVFDELEQTGSALSAQIKKANPFFNDPNNSVRMASLLGVRDSGECKVAFMKPSGPTNVFFNSGQLTGVTVPVAQTSLNPKNPNNYIEPGASQTYMAGYAPIRVLNRDLFGVPVFPQQNPHLVSFLDFSTANATFGSAPPNAVQLGSNTTEMKTGLLTGAVACAIVGATIQGTAGTGGTAVGQTLLGSGFQFPAAASYGYIEFGNFPANKAPPGYDPNDYSGNIFNNELFNTDFLAMGSSSQSSDYVTFGTDSASVRAWVDWAQGVTTGEQDAARRRADGDTTATYTRPPTPSNSGVVYVGPRDANLQGQGLTAGSTPSADQIRWLNMMRPPTLLDAAVTAVTGLTDGECVQQLQESDGLRGSCVAALGAITETYQHRVPTLFPGNNQQFSNADWAKAELLTEFEGRNPRNPGGYNNSVYVSLIGTAPDSGLGVYPASLVPGQVPATPPNMPTPENQLPLQRPGTIWQLIQAVQAPDCMTDTIKSITNRCKQIQPRATDASVLALLKGPLFPMAAAGPAPSWQNARKFYIYLPNGDLSQDLIISPVPPPKLTTNPPDGCCTYPSVAKQCYKNEYPLDGSIVDSVNDQKVHERPYLSMNGNLRVTDHATWQPGSGADNNFGRMTFVEVGTGATTFTHIN